MRHGMRAYTMGSAWWIGDCGPFWGHNALVRIAPFAEHCHLPVLPGGPPLGGHVLSHDQVEATLMRRAGYEVRVLPDESGSWEENPPTVLEFSTRDLRWCQGNMQYWKLSDLPGLSAMSRFQLAWAILMFVGVPAMTLMIALAPFKVARRRGPRRRSRRGAAIGLYVDLPSDVSFAEARRARRHPPDAGRRSRATAALWRFLGGAAIEIVFSFLLGAVTTFRHRAVHDRPRLRRSVVWNGQARDAHGIAWATACRRPVAAVLFGTAVCGALALLSPGDAVCGACR